MQYWSRLYLLAQSGLGGHPDMCKISGVSASTGSLGHGLPFAIGKVLAKRINGKKSKIFCLIGDGELNEGTIWESLLLASHHKLSELTLIVDSNKTSERALALGNIESKLESFDFLVKRIDGHSHNSILEGLTNFSDTKPIALIAQTIKGFGIKEMENNPAWHHAVPSEDELDRFLIELE
jgi:transketolase